MKEIKPAVRSFFEQHINIDELADDTDIFKMGYVNSLFALQIVNFVESYFGITLENSDLNVDNFRAIDNISQFVQRKLSCMSTGA